MLVNGRRWFHQTASVSLLVLLLTVCQPIDLFGQAKIGGDFGFDPAYNTVFVGVQGYVPMNQVEIRETALVSQPLVQYYVRPGWMHLQFDFNLLYPFAFPQLGDLTAFIGPGIGLRRISRQDERTAMDDFVSNQIEFNVAGGALYNGVGVVQPFGEMILRLGSDQDRVVFLGGVMLNVTRTD